MTKIKGERIVSFPRMGNLYIPISAVLEEMGANILLPPPNNKEALSLGTRHSPETLCIPYKMNLGNYIQALEAGANILLMFQAPGTCRLGNYASMAKMKLRDLGYDFEMIVFNLYKVKAAAIIDKFGMAAGNRNVFKAINGIKLCLAKFEAIDRIERELLYLRPREVTQGQAEKVYKTGLHFIETARTEKEINSATDLIMEDYSNIQVDKSKEILKIYLIGEFFVLLDTFVNMDIEKELGHLGVEVNRQIMLSEWMEQTIIPKWLRKRETHKERGVRTAKRYMTRIVGGECIENIGDTVQASQEDVDGVVHIGPFNCIPEIISQCIFPHVSGREKIPVLSFLMDEHTGKAGVVTRLEAFVDLMKRNKRKVLEAV